MYEDYITNRRLYSAPSGMAPSAPLPRVRESSHPPVLLSRFRLDSWRSLDEDRRDPDSGADWTLLSWKWTTLAPGLARTAARRGIFLLEALHNEESNYRLCAAF